MGYFKVKVCVLGSSGVGKTCITVRFVENVFNSDTVCTIGMSFAEKSLTTENGNHYQLQIWDTAGQERFKAIAPLYYRGAAVVLIVYDVTKRRSLTSGVREWMEQIRKNANVSELLLMLVGNKVDKESIREVDRNEAREYANSVGALYWETSAKTGYNIQELFMVVCTKLEGQDNKKLDYICDQKMNRGRSMTVRNHDNQVITEEPSPQKSSRCCG